METIYDNPCLDIEQSRQFIELMQKEGSRMQTLLSDLLTLSRLETRKNDEYTPINFSLLVECVADEGRALSANKHIIEVKTIPNLWINGIYTDLYNALSNLVFNSIRYSPEGSVIRISLDDIKSTDEKLPDLMRFTVCDNGPGIAAEHLPHLTERFYRVDKGRSRQNGGTGLGLAIVKHALAEHNSLLEIKSTLGEGSQFSAVFRQIPPIDTKVI